MLKYLTPHYRRHKRIKRILSLYKGNDAYQPKNRSSEGVLFPRYTWLRFFLTLAGIILVSIPLNVIFDALFAIFSVRAKAIFFTPFMMLVGFVIIEFIDEFFLEWEQSLDYLRSVVAPVMSVLLLVVIFIVLRNPDEFMGPLKQWRDDINKGMQSTPVRVVINPEQGQNWRFLYLKPLFLQPVTIIDAGRVCKGIGDDWRIYDGDKNFKAKPSPIISRAINVWMNGSGGQLSGIGIEPPSAFVSADSNSKFPVLCINKKDL